MKPVTLVLERGNTYVFPLSSTRVTGFIDSTHETYGKELPMDLAKNESGSFCKSIVYICILN